MNAPLSNATVELTDLDGNALPFPTATTDATGNFRIPAHLASLPAEFRVRVTPDSSSRWNLPMLADVRGYTSKDAVYPNILTTLAALYRERQGSTQDEALAWVRNTFAIPGSVNIGYGIDESRRSFFRHSGFLERAAETGGVSSYVASLLESAQVSGQGEGGIVFAEEPGFGTQVGTSIIANIGADVILFGVNKVFGLVAQALGLNIGDSDQIQEIGQELSSIQSGLQDLSAQITADFNQLTRDTEAEALFNSYVTLTADLNPTLLEIQEQTEDLAALASTTLITNTPSIPSQGLQNLLSGLSELDAQAALNQLASALLGPSETASLLKVYRQLLAYSLGVPALEGSPASQPVWADSPVLTNSAIFDPFERFLAFYVQQEMLALNLLVEDANLSLNPSTIVDARGSAADYTVAVGQQLQELGYPQASDLYFANPGAALEPRTKTPNPANPSGTIFYTQVQAPALGYYGLEKRYNPEFKVYEVHSDFGASFMAATQAFQAPGFDGGWRLPSLDELNQLRSLALQANPSDSLAGLARLGFTAPDGWTENPLLWYVDHDDPYIDGQYEDFEVQEDDFVKVYDFSSGTTYGYTPEDAITVLFEREYSYLQVRYQGFDETQSYENILAGGFRPTVPPTLTTSADGGKITATLNGQDISRYCVWSSGNPQVLEVVGLGDQAGTLIWHKDSNATGVLRVTASIEGMDATTCVPKTLQASLSFGTPNPPPPHVLNGILLSPSNTVLLDSSTPIPFSATGFYSDQTLETVTDLVTWSLERPDGTPYPANKATINGSSPGVLIFTGPLLNDSVVVVKATLGSVVGQTQLKVGTLF